MLRMLFICRDDTVPRDSEMVLPPKTLVQCAMVAPLTGARLVVLVAPRRTGTAR